VAAQLLFNSLNIQPAQVEYKPSLRLTSLAQWLPSCSSTLSTSSQLHVEYNPLLRLTSLAQWLPSYSSTISTSSQLQVEYKPSLMADQPSSVAAQLLLNSLNIQPASGRIQALS
jgi:hypothetical protein